MCDALFRVLVDVETHVGRGGWDQPAQLFALVDSARLAAAEPHLAAQLDTDLPPGSLSAVEQDGFNLGSDLAATFGRIQWGPDVAGCALAVERAMVPAEVESDLPADPAAAAEAVAKHPRRMDLRIVAGVLRDGSRHAVARLADRPDELVSGTDLVPGLQELLALTFE